MVSLFKLILYVYLSDFFEMLDVFLKHLKLQYKYYVYNLQKAKIILS